MCFQKSSGFTVGKTDADSTAAVATFFTSVASDAEAADDPTVCIFATFFCGRGDGFAGIAATCEQALPCFLFSVGRFGIDLLLDDGFVFCEGSFLGGLGSAAKADDEVV